MHESTAIQTSSSVNRWNPSQPSEPTALEYCCGSIPGRPLPSVAGRFRIIFEIEEKLQTNDRPQRHSRFRNLRSRVQKNLYWVDERVAVHRAIGAFDHGITFFVSLSWFASFTNPLHLSATHDFAFSETNCIRPIYKYCHENDTEQHRIKREQYGERKFVDPR